MQQSADIGEKKSATDTLEKSLQLRSSKPTLGLEDKRFVSGPGVKLSKSYFIDNRSTHTFQTVSKANVNADESLEKEADVMGAKATQMKTVAQNNPAQLPIAQPVIQMVWIEQKKGLLAWHGLRDGMRWFFNEADDTMFFIPERRMELSPQVSEFYSAYQRRPLPYDTWLELMTHTFKVDATELRDEDDPVFLAPEFLHTPAVDEPKVNLGQAISMALRHVGIQAFLGGAASATLFTQTRPINDLDFRVDGFARNAFTNAEDDALTIQISDAIRAAGLRITSPLRFVASTTIKGEIEGVEVSITSEPTSERTFSRGEMIPGLESIGEFQFLFDKAFAASNRPAEKIDSVATDVFDIIKTKQALPNRGAGILSCLNAYYGRDISSALIERLKGLLANIRGQEVPEELGPVGKAKGRMKRGHDFITKHLGISGQELAAEILDLIKELKNQQAMEII